MVMICHSPPSLSEQSQSVGQSGGAIEYLPDVPGRPDGRTVQDERGAQGCEKCGGDAEEADVERSDPKVEEVAADQRPPRTRYLRSKTQQRHVASSRSDQPGGDVG